MGIYTGGLCRGGFSPRTVVRTPETGSPDFKPTFIRLIQEGDLDLEGESPSNLEGDVTV